MRRGERDVKTHLHVGFEESSVIVVDGSRNGRPWSLNREHTLLAVTFDESSGGRIEKNGLDSEEGESSCSRLGLSSSRKRTVQREVVSTARHRGRKTRTDVRMMDPVSVCQ